MSGAFCRRSLSLTHTGLGQCFWGHWIQDPGDRSILIISYSPRTRTRMTLLLLNLIHSFLHSSISTTSITFYDPLTAIKVASSLSASHFLVSTLFLLFPYFRCCFRLFSSSSLSSVPDRILRLATILIGVSFPSFSTIWLHPSL